MKSRCCTFYKNTSESTSLCKLDTDSSPSPPVPCRSCLPQQPSNPEHKWLSAHVRVSRPERGRRVESTFPLDSATFFHFPSWRSAPAQLLILFLSSSLAVNAFFCCYSLYPGNQRTVVCLPRLRFMSISLSPVLFPSTAPLQFLYSYLQELSACVGNGRAESASCLKPGVGGKRELPIVKPQGS